MCACAYVFARVFARVCMCVYVCLCARVCVSLFRFICFACCLQGFVLFFFFHKNGERQVQYFYCGLIKMLVTRDIVMPCKFFKERPCCSE